MAIVEYYRFTIPNQEDLNICTAVDDQTIGGKTYSAAPIKRTSIKQDNNLTSNQVTISFSALDELFDKIRRPIESPARYYVNILRGEENTVPINIWAGQLLEQSIHKLTMMLRYGELAVALKKLGRRRSFQRRCNFALYDPDTCNATQRFRVGKVSAVGTSFIDVENIPDESGWYTAGIIESVENNERRSIVSHTKINDTARLRIIAEMNIAVNDTVKLIAGCDRTWQTCKVKFNNIKNFGGFPYAPQQDPYSYILQGDII